MAKKATQKVKKGKRQPPQNSGDLVDPKDKEDRDELGRFLPGHEKKGGSKFGSRHFSTMLKESLEEIGLANKKSDGSIWKSLVQTAIKQAQGGNFSYYQDLMNRVYGKPKEMVELSGEVGYREELLPAKQKRLRKILERNRSKGKNE